MTKLKVQMNVKIDIVLTEECRFRSLNSVSDPFYGFACPFSVVETHAISISGHREG